ncbi:MAG TPA: hypothetical protein VG389_02930 [Myxococcota bacterium]|jgi:hypothetical protein|nr:hypothetical protein [Myxococcota bacterium]
MKRMGIAVTVAVALVSLAASAGADERNVTVSKMVPVACETDGGPVGCSVGTKFIGAVFAAKWNEAVATEPFHCGTGKPTAVLVTVMYEYNEGSWLFRDTDAKKAKWPACVRDGFPGKATALLKEIFEKVRELDGSVDVRATWRISLVLN